MTNIKKLTIANTKEVKTLVALDMDSLRSINGGGTVKPTTRNPADQSAWERMLSLLGF